MRRRKEAGEKNGGKQGKERKQEEEREPYFKQEAILSPSGPPGRCTWFPPSPHSVIQLWSCPFRTPPDAPVSASGCAFPHVYNKPFPPP